MEYIYEEGAYRICLEYEVTEEMTDMLESTHWGTGKTVYQHFNSKEQLSLIPKPHIFTVRKNGKLSAFTVFCERYFPGYPKEGKSYYIRFFFAAPEVKGQGVVRNLSPIVMDWLREKEGQVFFYAMIESKNPAVKRVIQNVGFHVMARIKTTGFSRFFPKKKTQVQQLNPEEWNAFLPHLEDFYSNRSLFTKDNLYVHEQYFVVRKGDEILAGMQVHRAHWAVEKMPGLFGKFVLPALPHVPFINRIFNPKAFHFLAFEAFYHQPGQEPLLLDMIETLLAHFGQHAALFWLDERDPLYAFFQSQSLGMINSFVKHSNVSLIGSFHQYPEETVAAMKEKVFYLSSLDSV